MLERSGAGNFTGYDQIDGEATILGLLVDGAPVAAAGAGTDVDVVLDRTPFYAEGGGQLADAGRITVSGGDITVFDVQTPLRGLIVHLGKVISGEVMTGAPAFAEIDVERPLEGAPLGDCLRARPRVVAHRDARSGAGLDVDHVVSGTSRAHGQ